MSHRIEIDYAQVAANMGVVGRRGRDVEEAVRGAIRSLTAKHPGQRVVLMNRPGSIVRTEGDRSYLVNRDGTLTQISGDPLPLTVKAVPLTL